MPKAKASRQPPDKLLSIDPAKDAGWAFFQAGKPVAWGAVDGSTWKSLNAALQPIASLAAGGELVCEDGFFQYGKMTFKGTLTLGRRRGLAQAAAESIGIDKFTFIVPSTWQNGLGWRKGIDTKVWSLNRAKACWGITDISHDTADALNLGAYFIDSYHELA